ncbi:DUF262 domain-containing HNH endonuclease family protein [Planktothrix agardhii 1029]|jgi:uncharacterized protein with ParB-like and HNH nuclease domain|uniref:DUF262 domain-containing protein n=1 Tax=Planktothrix agardhii (strain NIVA-CYA 126/8) TaxID=388467 RepID=A0A073CB42_PLAA1|nr:DUF262 domain-containing protein [Planktothrix agardhii]KEI65296.1 hypothetical protein A19Y_9103 [Planktothrix agardhii NIVA-CYA 126/8]MCB8766639.1 DUF262 domain-containing HNH endonuclease family protein [Planktothrix agardhii 1809]MCB8780145.1 DUF262 domain-containing HNH endonuclease family protein [Planktothrix agardhii 1031]MCB8784510.1 DUF262 domain-containing HNH endonuclease family protein [Planktothrix agardhii 1808]MCF3568840.1 DUF262 domain-containing HNH endonuclease family pro
MEAAPAKVIQYFNGEKQNLIPLFQRPYTWGEDNWKTLWNDLMVQYDMGDTGTHFMGAIVSVPARSVPVGVSKYLIIDGQQRLTTVSLLLCVLRDCLDANSASRIQEVYLTNRFREPEDTLKFVPTQVDRDVYRAIALDRQVPENNKDVRMAAAYHFFRDKLLKGTDLNDDPIDISKVLTTLEQRLQVVMINLGEDDDPYLIFESLNFKGEPLTQADLVRNYLLMRFRHSISTGGEQERVHSKYWIPLEKRLKSDLPEFLRHYTMKDGDDIKQGGIYAAIKTKLKNMDATEAVEAEAQSMLRFGEFYARFLFPDQEETTSISECLENINELQVTTSYPLLLRLFDACQTGHLIDVELEKCLKLIESFVVRRAVCKIPTNSLNKLFIQLAKNFPEADHTKWLQRSLSSSRRFPKDAEFDIAFIKQPQYGSRITRFILCRLEQSFKHKETVDLSKVTIEHVMPQTMNQEWKDELGAEAEKIHNTWLDTFGNLTLTGYNSELGNLPFSEKKAKLENTHIELNRWILQQENWRVPEIEERAKSLLLIANKIWLSPSDLISD